MNGWAGGERAVELALQSVVTHIASHLRDSSVIRSRVEQALDVAMLSPDLQPRLRLALDHALGQARIRVVEDLVGLDPWPGMQTAKTSPGPAAPQTNTDPVATARRRLDLDRTMSSKRLAKVILTADEEVGLTLIARPSGEPLNRGGLGLLTGQARTAAEAMVFHNIGLVHSISRGYLNQGLEYEDLVQSGMVGLFRAVELFDPASGNKFSTYATHWIRQAVTRNLANEGRLIRLPVHMWELVRKVVMTRQQLAAEGRGPSRPDLAAACGIAVAKVDQCLALAPGAFSLDMSLGEDGFTLGDVVDAQQDSPESIEIRGLFVEDVERLLGYLTEREADVVRRRYGLAPHDEIATLDEIGKVYGVTRERIRQIEAKAMTRIRERLVIEGVLILDSRAA
ncbi:RNA polymerase sigma factor RpoD/SigA [Nocardioides sp. P86]|uniref:sigma-70 family RNA polymerase sigma factor n=1 Tax=Nocardioides sp. P86 TaxID=2939569 RepID=UPI00203F4F84|nr:sigma-70 family RNA polymerase sigma factor [Nocardioides sp. P86]MCM3515475.1 sigma-70 family RNA polymerase sigma factor [Nocardioides sp. P86]